MQKLIQGFLILCGVMLMGCSDDSEQFRKKAKLNIANAKSIVVYDGSTATGGRINKGGRTSALTPNLYKITVDGSLEQVRFVNEDNTEIDQSAVNTEMEVYHIWDVSKNYLLLNGGFLLWNSAGDPEGHSFLLVRKSDGAIFDLPDYNIAYYETYFPNSGWRTFQEDAEGNFYFLDYNNQIVKVNVSDPNNLSVGLYLPTGQTANFFQIDGDGNCIYQNNQATRIRKKQGGIYEFTQTTVIDFWTSSSGSFYMNDFTGGIETSIKKLDVDNAGNVKSNAVWSYTHTSPTIAGSPLRYGYAKIQKPNGVIFINIYGGPNTEFNETDSSFVNFDLPPVSSDAKIVSSEHYYYIASGSKLYRVSFENNSYEDVLPAGAYEVYTLNVNANDILQVSAMRFSDGKKIIAEINLQNELTVLEEEKDQDVLYLQRLN